MDEMVQFTAELNGAEIAGYCYIDGWTEYSEPTIYYIDNLNNSTEQVVVQGGDYESQEALKDALAEDHELLTYLWDFRNEDRTFQRPGYTLHINAGEYPVEFTEEDEQAFREKVTEMLTEDLEKVDAIRLAYYENFTSNVQYQEQVFNNNFIEDCIDEICDAILENDDAYLDSETAKAFVEHFVDYVACLYENMGSDKTASESERQLADKMCNILAHYDLEKALEIIGEHNE